MADLDAAKRTLLAELREHSLVIGEVTLSSGPTAQYYVDARRALLRPAGFRAAGELIAAAAVEAGAERGRRPGDGGDPARLRRAGGPGRARTWSASSSAASARSTACSAGSRGRSSAGDRCLVVEDTVTSGGSTVKAIERVREQGLEVAAVVAVVDRLAGGGEAIEAAADAPYRALVTIDELYPERPDRD